MRNEKFKFVFETFMCSYFHASQIHHQILPTSLLVLEIETGILFCDIENLEKKIQKKKRIIRVIYTPKFALQNLPKFFCQKIKKTH
jgi:hypothetical protein